MGRDRARVLIVCHANVCRSPMVERLARLALSQPWRAGTTGSPPAAGLEIASAGTYARAGMAMHPYTAQVLREHGCDDLGFLSQPVTPQLLVGSRLILTAGRAQRADCVRMAPATVGRTFTLLEFEWLAAQILPEAASVQFGVGQRLAALLPALVNARGELSTPPVEMDLPDPLGQPVQAFRRCAELAAPAVRQLVRLLDEP